MRSASADVAGKRIVQQPAAQITHRDKHSAKARTPFPISWPSCTSSPKGCRQDASQSIDCLLAILLLAFQYPTINLSAKQS